jgi:hypothetical protein
VIIVMLIMVVIAVMIVVMNAMFVPRFITILRIL